MKRAILLILILAASLRLVSLNQSLWLDEAINVLAAEKYSLWEMVTEYAKADFHPPGYLIILWLWTKLFGTSEILVRIPSVLFGVVTVFITYTIGKRFISQKIGLLAALLLAVNPLHIYYSQEARMYSYTAFATSLNFYFFLNNLKVKGGFSLGYFLSALLVLSSDYLAYLIFPTQFLILIIQKEKEVFKKLVISFLPAIAIWLIWLPMFFKQVNVGISQTLINPAWKAVVGDFGIKPLLLTFVKFIIGRISYPDKMLYYLALLPVGSFYLLLLIRAFLKSSKEISKLLLIWLALPATLGLGISFFIPIYSYFRMLFLLVPYVLALSLGIKSFENKKIPLFVNIIVLSISLFASFFYLLNPFYHREDWRGLVNFLQKNKNAITIFESTGNFAPFDYYSRGNIKTLPGLKQFPASNDAHLANLETDLAGFEKVYLVEYLVGISDPQRLLFKKMISLDFRQERIYNFNGVGFVYELKKL